MKNKKNLNLNEKKTETNYIKTLDIVVNIISIAFIIAIYINNIPKYNDKFMIHLIFLLFTFILSICIYYLYKIYTSPKKDYYKYSAYFLFFLQVFLFFAYILTYDFKNINITILADKIYNSSSIKNMYIYFLINSLLIYILLILEYTRNIHDKNIYKNNIFNREKLPDILYIFLYIIFLFSLPYSIYFIINEYFIENNPIMAIPNTLMSFFIILFTLVIPISMKNNLEEFYNPKNDFLNIDQKQ